MKEALNRHHTPWSNIAAEGLSFLLLQGRAILNLSHLLYASRHASAVRVC